MEILICDDDQKHNEIVKNFIIVNLDENLEWIIETFNSAAELVSFCLGNKPDILFLDIKLDDMNGIELAKYLRNEFPYLIIIYITNYPEYVFSCFETEPLNFLRKPLDKDEFSRTFKRAVSKYTEMHQFIPIKWQNDSLNIEIKDICYVEGYNRHLIFHLYNGDCYEVVGKLNDIYNILRIYGFVKSHQGFIVNMLYIKDFGENEIHMKNGDTVLMSVRKKLDTKKTYSDYLNRRF